MPVIAVACSLFGGAWLELARSPSQSAQGPGVLHRAAYADGPFVSLDCEKAALLAHSQDYNLPHLGNAALEAMDQISARSSGSAAALPGWRMKIFSDRGAGAITAVELPQGTCYVGDGVLAAWPAEDLAHAYIQLMPDPPPLEPDRTQAE